MAYLSYMANRLRECWRALRPSGSIYLHCDPTMSHYLKVVMDGIFERRYFRNEIVWKRTPFSGSSKARAKQLPRDHDIILLYSKGAKHTWNQPTEPYMVLLRFSGEHLLKQEVFYGARNQVYDGVQARGGAPRARFELSESV